MTQAALRDFKTACVNGGRLFRCTRQGGDSTASIMARRKGREREKERTEMKEYVRFKSIRGATDARGAMMVESGYPGGKRMAMQVRNTRALKGRTINDI